jgi:hypothetical protein
MLLKELFGGLDYLFEALRPSTETRKFLDDLIKKYNIDYNRRESVFTQDYPSASARSQFIKMVKTHILSLQNDIVEYLKTNKYVDPTSITVSSSKYRFEMTNELSLSRHILFKLIDFPAKTLQIRISDHFKETNKNTNTYFMNISAYLDNTVKGNLDTFIKGVYDKEYTKVNGAKKVEIVKTPHLTPRPETLKRKTLSLKPKKPEAVVWEKAEPNNKLPSALSTYNDLVSPTKSGKREGFFYDMNKLFSEQEFPNEEVKQEYENKLKVHRESLLNDLLSLIYHRDGIDKNSIKTYRKTVGDSEILYLGFKFDGAEHWGMFRISDNISTNATTPKTFIFSIRDTSYLSDNVKGRINGFLNFLKRIS